MPAQVSLVKIAFYESVSSHSYTRHYKGPNGNVVECKSPAWRPAHTLMATNSFYNHELTSLLYAAPHTDMTFAFIPGDPNPKATSSLRRTWTRALSLSEWFLIDRP